MKPIKAEEIDIEKMVLLTLQQAKSRYNIGSDNIRAIADNIGATVRIGESGGKVLYHRKKLDNYFDNYAE